MPSATLKNPFPIESRYSPFSIILRHKTLWEKIVDTFFVFNGNARSHGLHWKDLFFSEGRLGVFDYICGGIGFIFYESGDLFNWIDNKQANKIGGKRAAAMYFLNWGILFPILIISFVLYLLFSPLRPITSGLLTLIAFPFILLVHEISLPFSTPLHQTLFNQTEPSYKVISDALLSVKEEPENAPYKERICIFGLQKSTDTVSSFMTSTQAPIMAIAKPNYQGRHDNNPVIYPDSTRGGLNVGVGEYRLSNGTLHTIPTSLRKELDLSGYNAHIASALYYATEKKQIIDCDFIFYRIAPGSTEKQILLAALKLNLDNITARMESEGRLKPLLETLQYQADVKQVATDPTFAPEISNILPPDLFDRVLKFM